MAAVLTRMSTGTCPTAPDSSYAATIGLLSAVVERVAAAPFPWEPLVGDGSRHVWARVPVGEAVDVWVATWPTFEGTQLHSHDEASTAFRTVRGVLTEIRTDDRARLLPRKYEPGLTGVVAAGEIHDLRNELATPAVTIHAYTPGLRSITYYDWTHGRISAARRVYADNCAGAHNWPGA